ncbi:hypothetical protein ACHAQJ_004429 [Trichoderma viride]
MEAIGAASSVIAVIEISAKIIILCTEYIAAVANARADIKRLQDQVKSLEATLRHASHLLEQPNSQLLLSASRELDDPLMKCQDELQRLQAKLEPSAARKAMRRFSLRAIRWPFNKGDVEAIIASLVGYRDAITAVLQIDQTTLLLNIHKGIENLSLQTAENTSAGRKSHFIMPFPRDPDFVDRPALRVWLEEQYAGPIAIEFAHRMRIASPDTSVFWVNGSSEAKFEESYRSLADALTLPRRHDPKVNILALVRDWFHNVDGAPWLIILENADEMETFFPKSQDEGKQQEPLASYLPKTGNGKMLITSRNISVAEKLTGGHKTLREVPTMDSLEALRIFQNKLIGDIDQDAAVDLVHALEFIPLAVNQAAAYINRRAPRVSIRSYLDDFRQSEGQKKSLLHRDAGDLRRHEEVSNSVVVTWQVTFEQIRQERPAAANLLLLMSFFQPQNIPDFMLSGYDIIPSNSKDGNSDNDEDLEEDLDILRAYSLIKFSTTSGFCEMHSLVQFCTQVWLSESNGGDFARLKSLFLSLSAMHFPDGTFETWAKCQILLPHMGSLLYEQPIDETDILDWSQLLTNISWYMLMIGDNSGAERTAQKAANSRKRILGDEHLDTLRSMSNLSSVYWKQGRWAEAELLEVQVMDLRKRVLGGEHPDTVKSMANLASTYFSQGRFTEAELLEVKVMEMNLRALGKEHPETLKSMAHLASTYRSQGRLAETELLEVQVMDTRKAVLGDEHPDTLKGMANLALTYWNQGRLTEAESLGVQVTEMRKRVLGNEYPDTLISMSNLALTYMGQGRLSEAESLGMQVTETRKRVLGDEHPATLASIVNLAHTFQKQGRLDEALVLLRDCVSRLPRILGPEHPFTLSSLETLRTWEQDST